MAGDGVRTEKKWYRSRTVWFNTAATAFAIAEQVQPFIPLDPMTFGVVVSVGNIILRRFTTTAITK